MHKVYTHSHLNISASDARDGRYGLFRAREGPIMKQMRCKATLEGADGLLRTKEYVIKDSWYWHVNVEESHIHSRGWVFQERIMVPRVLYFAKNQLAWECQHHSACEKYPHGMSPSFLMSSYYKQELVYDPSSEVVATRNRNTDGQGPEEWQSTWNYLTMLYSQTQLSRPSDKLLAISGLAESWAARTGDTYVAEM